MAGLVLVLPVLEDLVKVWQSSLSQQSDTRDQSRNTSSCKGTSRETNQEDLISALVVVGKERIGFTYVLRQAGAGSATHNLIPDAGARADSCLIVDYLLHTLLALSSALWKNGTADSCHICRCLDMTVLLPRPSRVFDEPTVAILYSEIQHQQMEPDQGRALADVHAARV